MRRWFVLACAIAGCWRAEPPIAPTPPTEPADEPPPRLVQRGPEPGSFEEVMGKMGEFRDKMCGCSDTTCAQGVSDEMTKWSIEMANRADKHRDMKPTDDQIRQMTDVTQELTKCMTAAISAGSTLGNP